MNNSNKQQTLFIFISIFIVQVIVRKQEERIGWGMNN